MSGKKKSMVTKTLEAVGIKKKKEEPPMETPMEAPMEATKVPSRKPILLGPSRLKITGASGRTSSTDFVRIVFKDIQECIANDNSLYMLRDFHSNDELYLFFVDLYEDYTDALGYPVPFPFLMSHVHEVEANNKIKISDSDYVEKMTLGFQSIDQDEKMIEQATDVPPSDVQKIVEDAQEVNADPVQNVIDDNKVMEVFKNNLIETNAKATEEEFTQEVASVEAVIVDPVTEAIQGNVVPSVVDQGVQTPAPDIQTQAADTQPVTQAPDTQDQGVQTPAPTATQEPQVPADVMSGSGKDTLGTPAQYHKTAINLFFLSVDKPQWDYTLSASIRQANTSYEERKEMIDAIIQNEGYKILVSKVKSDYTLQEYVEILQLHFSANRNMAKGSRMPEVNMSLGQLLSFRNALTGQTQGTQGPIDNVNNKQPVTQTQTQGPNTNFSRPDIAKVMDNTNYIMGYNRMGPRRDLLGKQLIKNVNAQTLINPKGPGNLDSDINLKYYRQQQGQNEPAPKKPNVKDLVDCITKT